MLKAHPLVWFCLCRVLFASGQAETWEDTRVLSNGHLTVHVVPAIGRMIRLSSGDGANLLRQHVDLIGHTRLPEGRWNWNDHGGDWLWPVAQDRWALLGVERRWP